MDMITDEYPVDVSRTTLFTGLSTTTSSSRRGYQNDSAMVTSLPQTNTDVSRILDQLSDEMAMKLLPVLVYLGILMIVGVVGNCLVLYVHFRKFKPSTTRTYVLSLALFDLLSCFMAVPGEMFDVRYSYTFTNEALCKAERFCTTLASLGSGFVLMAVAVDRYRRICHPLKQQLQTRGARKMVVGATVLSLIFSWPSVIIYGSKDKKFRNITGVECSTDQFLISTHWPKIYTGILFLTFIVCFTTMIVLYTLIGRRVYHQKKFRKSSTSMNAARSRTLSDEGRSPQSPVSKTPSSPVFHKSPSFPSEPDAPSYDEGPSEYSIASVDPHAKSVSLTRKPSLLKRFTKSARDSMTRKTTFMLFLITLVFVLSFLPHLLLKGVQSVKKTFLQDASTAGLIFYNIFVRSYFINSISNAFIYGFCSPRFRKETTALFKTLICRQKCGSFSISKVKK